MFWLKLLIFFCSVFNFSSKFAKKPKEKNLNSVKFAQSSAWPDCYWLRDLEFAVEQCLKQNIVLAKQQLYSPDFKNVINQISNIFSKHIAELVNIEQQLQHTGFECLSEFETETRGLQDWLTSLSETLKNFKPKILEIVEQQNKNSFDKRFWLSKPDKMLIEVRRIFVDLFSDLAQIWSQELPELICSQTNPNHSEILEIENGSKKIDVEKFFQWDVVAHTKELNGILAQNFRDATDLNSIRARKKFYNFIIKLSEQVRLLTINDLCGMSCEEYSALYNLIELFATSIIIRHKQLMYDQVDFGFFVKKSAWIVMYWFYNIFPYKNFPWEDENFLVIENLFRQVSQILSVGAPYTFKFNNTSRYKFKNYSKGKKERFK